MCNPRFVYPKYRVSCCLTMSNVSLRIKQNIAELLKQNVTVTSVQVATREFLFGMYYCAVDRDVGTGNFSLMLGIGMFADMHMLP